MFQESFVGDPVAGVPERQSLCFGGLRYQLPRFMASGTGDEPPWFRRRNPVLRLVRFRPRAFQRYAYKIENPGLAAVVQQIVLRRECAVHGGRNRSDPVSVIQAQAREATSTVLAGEGQANDIAFVIRRRFPRRVMRSAEYASE